MDSCASHRSIGHARTMEATESAVDGAHVVHNQVPVLHVRPLALGLRHAPNKRGRPERRRWRRWRRLRRRQRWRRIGGLQAWLLTRSAGRLDRPRERSQVRRCHRAEGEHLRMPLLLLGVKGQRSHLTHLVLLTRRGGRRRLQRGRWVRRGVRRRQLERSTLGRAHDARHTAFRRWAEAQAPLVGGRGSSESWGRWAHLPANSPWPQV